MGGGAFLAGFEAAALFEPLEVDLAALALPFVAEAFAPAIFVPAALLPADFAVDERLLEPAAEADLVDLR